MTERFVVDASVAVKWFLAADNSEADVDQANEVLTAFLAGEVELHAPRLMTYEACRVLWKACLTPATGNDKKRLALEDALECTKTLFELPIQIAEATAGEAARAIAAGVRFYKNFYDMTYLKLAEELECQVITADTKLLHGAPQKFPLHRFLLLSNFRREKPEGTAPENAIE